MENDIDLFACYEDLPKEVIKIIDYFQLTRYDRDEKDGYDACREFITELEKVGYTCGFGLDAEPYELKKL